MSSTRNTSVDDCLHHVNILFYEILAPYIVYFKILYLVLPTSSDLKKLFIL